jgi:hypothetical protein
MVEEADTGGDGAHLLLLEGTAYLVLGEEIVEPEKQYDEEVMRISQDFVIFPQRRKDPSKPSLFLLPPVGFPELEIRKESLGIERIVSASPSSPTDELLRKTLHLSASSSLATLLLGFDTLP